MRIYHVYSREHNSWWAPHHRGYVQRADRAGLYTLSEATSICTDAGLLADGGPAEFYCIAPQFAQTLHESITGIAALAARK